MKPLLDTSQRMGERAREGACPNAQSEAGLSVLPKAPQVWGATPSVMASGRNEKEKREWHLLTRVADIGPKPNFSEVARTSYII